MFEINYDCMKDILIYLQNNLHYIENSNQHCEINWVTIINDKKLNQVYSKDTIRYTLEKLKECNFINASSFKLGAHKNILHFCINDITVSGHNFLNDAKNDKIWDKFKSKLTKFGSVSLPVALQMLAEEAKIMLFG